MSFPLLRASILFLANEISKRTTDTSKLYYCIFSFNSCEDASNPGLVAA